MIQRLDISGVHMVVGADLHKYVSKKIGRLDRYIPKHARPSAHAEVKLKEGRAKDKQARTCEVLVHLPHDNLTVSETTANMYAAIDIVEAKLKNQLRKYKERHAEPRLGRRLLSRFQSAPHQD